MPSRRKSRTALIERIVDRLDDGAQDRYSTRKTRTLLVDLLAYLQRTPPMGVEAAGAKGGSTVARERGRDYFSEIGKKGGQKTLATHGPGHFTRVGRLGGKAGKADNIEPVDH